MTTRLLDQLHLLRRRTSSSSSAADPDASGVKRALFGPVDHEANLRFVRQELDRGRKEASQRWNYDFENDRPQEGRFQWEVMMQPSSVTACGRQVTAAAPPPPSMSMLLSSQTADVRSSAAPSEPVSACDCLRTSGEDVDGRATADGNSPDSESSDGVACSPDSNDCDSGGLLQSTAGEVSSEAEGAASSSTASSTPLLTSQRDKSRITGHFVDIKKTRCRLKGGAGAKTPSSSSSAGDPTAAPETTVTSPDNPTNNTALADKEAA